MGENPRGAWRKRITYANAMSTLAAVLAVTGGTAIAASRLQPASVNSATVKDGSLRSADLADGKGVRGADVADGSLGGADVADGSLAGADLADDSLTGADFATAAVGAAQIGAGAVGKAQLSAGAVGSGNIADGSIGGIDVGTDTITAKQLPVSTLDSVPEAASVAGLGSAAFDSAILRQYQLTPDSPGRAVGDGSFELGMGCEKGKLLAGGPADLLATTTVNESSPVDGSWFVRVNPHGFTDPFTIVVLCAVNLNGF
jgi:hypothetical protein